MPTASDTPLVVSNRVLVYNAAFSAASVSAAWTAGAYRRVEVFVKLATGATANILVALAGLSAGSYYTTAERTGAAGAWTDGSFSAIDAWKVDLPPYPGAPAQLDIRIQAAQDGSQRMFTGMLAAYTGQGIFLTGTSVDTTNKAAGVTVTFTVSCTGWLEVVGYV